MWYNIGMKTNKSIVGIFDEKAHDLVFAQVYPSFDVGCRELFRQVWREDFKVANYVDDYKIVDMTHTDEDGNNPTVTLRELAQRYGVM